MRMNPPVLDGLAHGRRTVYLAARYSRYSEMQGVRDVLAALGYTVTSRWIEAPEGKYGRGSFTVDQLNDDPGYCAAVAQRDMDDIDAASTLIVFTEPLAIAHTDPLEGPGKGGRHVELGYALARFEYGHFPVRIIVCGPREHVFHTARAVEWYPDWSRLVMALTKQARSQECAR